MKAKKVVQTNKLEEIPNVGPRIAADLKLLGIHKPIDLKGKDPINLYEQLNLKNGNRHDACVVDKFMAAADFMNGGKIKPWWKYTTLRKSMISKKILKCFLIVFSLVFFQNISVSADSTSIRIALTVDDLPLHGAIVDESERLKISKDLLDLIDQHHIPNVFGFVNAEKVAKNPSLIEILKLWIERGHSLGNHTYSHEDLSMISKEAFIEEIKRGELVLSKLSKSKPFKYFRFPFLHEGNTQTKRNSIRNYLKTSGYTYSPVTIDYKDYLFNEPLVRCLKSEDRQALKKLREFHLENAMRLFKNQIGGARTLFNKDIAHIMLIHVGISQAQWFGDVASALEKLGVKWISLDEALKDTAYEINTDSPKVTGGLLTNQIAKIKGVSFTSYPDEKKLEDKLALFCKSPR
jgi:peptidoglycan/xylan/chitin deacetylase (PgdA/CDA1 family)